jgi:alpha-2-macroglobulin
VSDSEGCRYFVGKTDQNGVLFLEQGRKFPAVNRGRESAGASDRPIDLSKLNWAVAATPTDACAVELQGFQLKPFAVKQVQELTEKLDARTAYVFTERGIYRPGETVQFKFFARAYQDNKIVARPNDVVKVTIVNPRQDLVYTKEFKLSEYGTCYDTFPVEKFFPSGTYTLKAELEKKDGEKASCSRTFLVQEYKRPRHVVTLALKPGERPAKEYVSVQRKDEFVSADIKARYYTGGPVKHAKVRWKAMLAPVTHKVEGFGGYMFGNEDSQTLFLESGESLTDGDGMLNVAIPLDPRLLTGIYGVNVSATVLDIDGEPATETATYQPKPRFMVGISKHPNQVQNGYATPLRLVVVQSDGKKASQGTIDACIMEKKYFYTQKRDDAGNVNNLWEEGWMKGLSSQVAVVNGEAVFNLQLNNFGDYLIAFSFEDKSGKYSSQTCFKVGWEQYDEWIRQQSEKEVRTTSEVLLSTTKKEFRAGETVRVSFHVPRPVTKCLVALEKSQVLDYRVIDVNGTEGNYEFVAKESFQPNVFVSIVAAAGRQGYPVYPSQVDTDIPTVFYGCADITVRSDTKKFGLEIEPGVAELKARPADKKTLAFKVTGEKGQGIQAELAVCVVDEAVLALTGFKTPELSSLTDFNLPLAVFSGDVRTALVSQDLFRILSTRPLTGGDMGSGEMAASLKVRKDFRPVAYFNPSVITDAAGTASVTFTLPDSTTAYRIYAVACDKGSGFASAQRNMVVSKEFFLEPSPPRFLIPGDRVTFPISVNNKTGEKGQATLEAESSKDIKLEPARLQTDVPPWSASVAHVSAEALGGADKAMIRFKGSFASGSQKYLDIIEQTFPIHSRYMPVNRTIVGGFSRRAEVPVDLPDILKTLKPHEIVSADLAAHIGLSTAQWTKITPGLKYMLHYPYGCVEQTSSGVIPLAGIRGLVQAGKIPGITKDEVDKFLKGGVERLLGMQVASGGFAYWTGQLEPSWWGTMYATFALSSAREAGYPVPEKNMKAALQYLHNNLFKKGQGDPFHGAAWTKEFALINLARADMLSSADLEPYFGDYASLTDQGKALLLLAAKKTGSMPDDKIREMLDKINPLVNSAQTSYFDSSVRQLAVCLMAAVEAGAKTKADSWAAQLMQSVKPDGKWYSTADTGWALLALSGYFKGADTTTPKTVKVRIDCGAGKPIEAKVSDTSAYVAIPVEQLLQHGKLLLESDGDTLVNYTISLVYPDMASDPSHLNQGFILRKTIENLNGKEEIRVGDLLKVTLDIELDEPSHRSRGPLEYLVLEDPVPAGLVPISSELKTEGAEKKQSADEEPQWQNGFYVLNPTYVEFRDDGVRVFKNRFWSDNHRYSYLVRAVAQGEFWMRGSRVSLMYSPETYGKTLGRHVTVLPVGK